MSVGPVGWVVLEAIASLAPPDAGRGRGGSAAHGRWPGWSGLSKDTVARSLASLIALGDRRARFDHRDELSGRFLSATYRVDLSTVGISVVVPQIACAGIRARARPRALPLETLPLSSASSADPPPPRSQLTPPASTRSSRAPAEDPSTTPVQCPETNHQAVTDLHPDAGPVPIRDFPNRRR